ncbi:protein SOGA1 [Osmerus eperlanus]|uniref:protein SOGA1 n=1 Tax=Osmerus eperlanus TaxID=29151 RepID=UPI002E0FAB1B
MTKTKADVHSPTHSVSQKERRLRLKMDNGTESAGSGLAQPQQQHQFEEQPAVPPVQRNEKKKINRAPSPARPKDVPGWSLTKIRGGIGTPTLSVKPGSIHLGSRVSRRSPGGGKETKSEKAKMTGKSTLSVASAQKSTKSGRRKVSDASIASDDLSKDSGCAPGKLSPTDSSSELSDCASEENKLSTDALSSDTESSSRGGGPEVNTRTQDEVLSERSRGHQHAKTSVEKDRLSLGVETGEGSISPGDERSLTSFDSRVPASTSLAFSDLTEEYMDGMHEEFVREIEELRSENDYLKDEMEELRSEMLEMRDMYLEEDVYQLQELRQQLDMANKTCRILQYRLRKAERRSVRVAQTGQVDGELIRTLEQDVKVAKDVSIRLHNELDSVEKRRGRVEEENEELRVRLQDLEVAKQVLQAEMEKSRENSQKKRGARPNNKADKKQSPQEDSSDLKCQLHFAKEESALMCKKLAKMAKDSEAMRDQLAKYRSLYGEVDASLTVEEVAESPHTREAEVRVHLKLVEEEANLLSRRIVELEVENRGLRAEMDDMKGQDLSAAGGIGAGLSPGGGGAGLVLGGASAENVMELQRHLQFVEEEAELLRRSLLEMEEQNKLLMNDINRYKSELPPPLSPHTTLTLADGPSHPSATCGLQEEGVTLISAEAPPPQEEELLVARMQIGELSNKVKKLQYENRVLLSNLQRCDLASYQGPSHPARPALITMETDAEAGDSAECLPSQVPLREGPVGGENRPLDELERKRRMMMAEGEALGLKDHETLLAMRDQARLITTAIQLLTAPDSNCLSPQSLYQKISTGDAAEADAPEKPQVLSLSQAPELAERPLVGALTSRLQALQTQLQVFVERVETLSSSPGRDQEEGASPPPALPESGDWVSAVAPVSAPCPSDLLTGDATSQHKQPDCRDQSDCEVRGQQEEADSNRKQETSQDHEGEEKDAPLARQVSELQALLLEARETARRAQQDLALERQAHRDNSSLALTQLQEEHQKALVRRDFQLQSASLQTRLQHKLWSQERSLLLQESLQLKHSLLLLSLKLRCFLKQWRLGRRPQGEARDVLEVNSLKDLYLLLEEENLTSPSHQPDNKMAASEEHPLSPTIKELCLLDKSYSQSSEVSGTLSDLTVALQDLSAELREEHQGSQELTQQFARAKASWEVERTELKSLLTQLDGKTGKAAAVACGDLDPPDLKAALKREREEHQHLLADSYAAVMDLTKQLQIGERNWSREKLELLERLSQERGAWEQRLREAQQQGKTAPSLHDKPSDGEASVTSETNSPRTKSIPSLSELGGLLEACHEVNGSTNKEEEGGQIRTPPLLLARTDLGDLTRKNWAYLTHGMEPCDSSKTWDGPSSSQGAEPGLESVQRSHTAPDRTGIRIYYSPPAVRRMETSRRQAREVQQQAQQGHPSLGSTSSDAGGVLEASSSSYQQWLSSLSNQHRAILESRAGLEISANLSDDMKEMTNVVRQAIRSSSLERKGSKDAGSQTPGGVATHSTQTTQFVSVGLQTDAPSRGVGLHSKVWSPRPSSSLAAARSRHISTSLDKVHGRIERPCCSPKYGSPKLQRRVSAGSASRLDGSSTSVGSRDRSLWSLRGAGGGGGGGSAWARSTTTRDSPVLSGLNDGLSSLFSVVEHAGSVEALWRADGGAGTGQSQSQGASPAKQPAAGKPSGAVPGPEAGAQKYGLVQEFFRNVCGSRTQGPLVGVSLGMVDEPKPDCVSGAGLGGLGGSDSVTRIVNKRFMRHIPREELVATVTTVTAKDLGNPGRELPVISSTEDAACDCSSQSLSSCITRPSRSATRHSLGHCKHRPQESPIAAEEKGDTIPE